MSTPSGIPSTEVLSRYIDRFLFAEGWRVTDVVAKEGGARYEVTLTRKTGENRQQSVKRDAPSAGEATFLACSSARQLGVHPDEAE